MSTHPLPEQPPTPAVTSVADELSAMRRIARLLDDLDLPARARVAAWLTDRYTSEVPR